MSSLCYTIVKVEDVWLKTLQSHLSLLYANFHLPSHDLAHHHRVWAFCRTLMLEMEDAGFCINQNTVIQALIACMFHDTGLIRDSGERHGYQSRLFCEEFFKATPNLKVNGMDKVLSAIEDHDDKSLRVNSESKERSFDDIHKLVSTADDLDAFGYIGVFRYIEIYLIRGIPMMDLSTKVMVNLTNRFSNFETSFSFLNRFVKKNKVRYQRSYNFFDELNQKKQNENALIVSILANCLIEKKMDIHQTMQHASGQDYGDNVKLFFANLKNEFDFIHEMRFRGLG